jgi:hypothetical protein
MGTFKHRHVARQKPLTDTTEQAHQITAPGPNAFQGVVMDFPNTVTVIIARPLAASWCMANRLVTTAAGGEVLIGRPFIGIHDRIGARMGDYKWFQRGAISPFTDLEANVATAAPDESDNRETIAGPGPVATRFVCAAAGWVEWIRVWAAFLFGVLVQFVGFGYWVGEWRGRGKNAPPQACVSRAAVPGDECD